MDELVEFVGARLEEDVDSARRIGNMLITSGAAQLGVSPEGAQLQARARLQAAEVRVQLFEETVLPYLGTAGPTGRIAEQQLRLFAAVYAYHRAYREDWRP